MSNDRYPEVFTCWKEIAAYLGKGVRTVQRWEQEIGLPVRRPDGTENSNKILALRSEIDEWREARWKKRRPYIRQKDRILNVKVAASHHGIEVSNLRSRLSQTWYQVLTSQIDLSLTYLQTARLASSSERRVRCRLNAESALKKIVRLRGLLEIGPVQLQELDGKLTNLRQELMRLSGEDSNNLLEAIANLEYLVKVSGSGELRIAYAAKLSEYRGRLGNFSA
jgi:hypothetical protein